MNLAQLATRAEELMKLGQEVLNTTRSVEMMGDYVDAGAHSEFRTGGLSFLKRTFGADSPFFTEFDSHVSHLGPSSVQQGIGILQACLVELKGGWLVTVKGIVSAAVFSDFLEMAEHLLSEHYKDPAWIRRP